MNALWIRSLYLITTTVYLIFSLSFVIQKIFRLLQLISYFSRLIRWLNTLVISPFKYLILQIQKRSCVQQLW